MSGGLSRRAALAAFGGVASSVSGDARAATPVLRVGG
jgi:hypothetical protein